jgi:PAS domain S-box-containing protein
VGSESSADFRSLVTHSGDAYFRYRLAKGMEWVNQGFCELTGFLREEIVGRRGLLEETIPPEARRELEASIQRFRLGEVESSSVVTRLRRADGTWVWVEIFVVPIRDEAGTVLGVEGVARDVSQHLAVADLLSRRTREQGVLLRLQREILSHIDSDLSLGLVVQEAQATLRADECALYLGRDVDNDFACVAVSPAAIDAGDGWLARWVSAHGQALRVANTREDVRADPSRPDRSVLGAPLVLGDQTAGALVARGAPDQFVESDLDFLVARAQVASLAIANLRSYHEV